MRVEPIYQLSFKPGWDCYFRKWDKNLQQPILKKLEHLKQELLGRGLHASRYLVEEVGQNRIVYWVDEQVRVKHIHFVGNHKQYEKWYKENQL